MSDEPDERPPSEKVLTAEELIRRHQLGIWRYLRMLGCDDSLADDLTQETLVKVICQESFSQWSQSATAAYLRRTARNLLITHHRKGGRVKTIVTDDPLDEIWDRWAGSDLSGDEGIDCLRVCLDSITDRARLALQMRFAENASRASIAEKLGISEHGARNLMQRAKQQLRDCVQSKLTEVKNKRDPGERNRWPEAETER